jgi:hypothetical protein
MCRPEYREREMPIAGEKRDIELLSLLTILTSEPARLFKRLERLTIDRSGIFLVFPGEDRSPGRNL